MENSYIQISEICGLCAGCKNAIQTAKESLKTHENVTLFKEIVHNKNVNNHLQSLGIKIKNQIGEITPDEFVILRAHGEPPETYRILKNNGIDYADCTCFNVKHIHDLVREHSALGETIILLGKYGKHSGVMHPEVLGIIGNISSRPILIEDEEDLENLTRSFDEKFFLVCQTTFNNDKADRIIEKAQEITKANGATLNFCKTICNAQKNINIYSKKLAEKSDIMIVVGGKNSSNSQELYNNLKETTKTIFIEDISDWKNELLRQGFTYNKSTRFGITAGASTMIDELYLLKDMITKDLGETNETKN